MIMFIQEHKKKSVYEGFFFSFFSRRRGDMVYKPVKAAQAHEGLAGLRNKTGGILGKKRENGRFIAKLFIQFEVVCV